jgi:hypothetical protein
VLAVAATALAACSDSMPESATPGEKAACARLVDIDRDRQIADQAKMLEHLDEAVSSADDSPNEELQRLLHRIRDDYDWLLERRTADDESMTVTMRASANLTLARVECRERGLLLDNF